MSSFSALTRRHEAPIFPAASHFQGDSRLESQPATIAVPLAVPLADRAPALMTIAFGLVVLFCVGFLQTPTAHNGAHDTRHANGFPCH